jgi:hypothetical protein
LRVNSEKFPGEVWADSGGTRKTMQKRRRRIIGIFRS